MAALPFPSPLQFGILKQRYKRFLADIVLDSGQEVTAHCPNSGAMLGIASPGMRVGVSRHDGNGRKHAFTWEVTDDGGVLVGVNTARPNRLAGLALAVGAVPELDGYETIRPEIPVPGGRLDFFLSHGPGPGCYVEVKFAHLKREGFLEFPDCRTERGTKHLGILAELAKRGQRAAMLYVGQRDDCEAFRLAADLDPAYAQAFAEAKAAGVEAYCYTTLQTPDFTEWGRALEVRA
jgi:sugar fermentation stimulation protein A